MGAPNSRHVLRLMSLQHPVGERLLLEDTFFLILLKVRQNCGFKENQRKFRSPSSFSKCVSGLIKPVKKPASDASSPLKNVFCQVLLSVNLLFVCEPC